jgi:hypothetical protein
VGSANTPRPLTVALAIPDVTDQGYFQLTIDAPQQQQATSASFCNYGEYFPAAQAQRIPLTVTASASKTGWTVTLAVDVAKAKEMMK